MNFFVRKFIETPSKEDKEFYRYLKKVLNFKPRQLNFYKKAFTHSSSRLFDRKGKAISYQRLEFLGDAMLGSIIAAYLYEKSPTENEGYLTKMRSKIVSRKHLNDLGEKLKLMDFVKINAPQHNISANICGDVFEALIGAIYLDRGYGYCENFIYEKILKLHVDLDNLENKITNYKGLLIEWCQKNKKIYKFDSFEDTGNQEQKHFSVKIFIDERQVAKARSTSKKKAEEKAAKRAYYVFQNEITV